MASSSSNNFPTRPEPRFVKVQTMNDIKAAMNQAKKNSEQQIRYYILPSVGAAAYEGMVNSVTESNELLTRDDCITNARIAPYAPPDCQSAFPQIYVRSATEIVYALNEHKQKVHLMIPDDVDAETSTEIRKAARVLGVSMPRE